MKRRVFYTSVLAGLIIIIILSLIIPSNPYKIIPSITQYTISKPLWLDIVIIASFIYFIIIYYIYEKLIKEW